MGKTWKWVALALAIAVAGCDYSSPGTKSAPTSWAGAEPHLVAVGSIEGETVSFDLHGADADVEKVFCERNYIVPDVSDMATWDEGYLEKIELKWLATVNGQEREYQIELSSHDFLAAQNGASVPVVAYDEDDTERLATRLMAVVQWQYEEAGEEVEVEVGSETGSFVRGVLSGTPGASGVVVPDGEGQLGGYLHLAWANGDVLDLSFTATCGENDLDIP